MESRRRWLIASVAIPSAAVLVSLLTWGFPREPGNEQPQSETTSTTHPPLWVSAFDVNRVKEVKAEVWEAGSEESKSSDSVKSSVIDVTVKNTGSNTIVIKSVEFRFRFAEALQLCADRGGPVLVSGHYTVKLQIRFRTFLSM